MSYSAFQVPSQAELTAHLEDTEDAHDASAISLLDTAGLYDATNVEDALAEIGAGPSPDSSYAWMPLTSVVAGDPVLVWDGDDSLIPTLTPIGG